MIQAAMLLAHAGPHSADALSLLVGLVTGILLGLGAVRLTRRGGSLARMRRPTRLP